MSALLLLLACTPSVTCGPGTVLDGTTCVIHDAADPVTTDSAGDDSASTDSGGDTGAPLDTSDTAPEAIAGAYQGGGGCACSVPNSAATGSSTPSSRTFGAFGLFASVWWSARRRR